MAVPFLQGKDEVRKLGDALLERCRQMVHTRNQVVAVGASLGVAVAPRDGTDAATLLRRADTAMYKAKEAGRNRLEFFEPDMEETMLRRAELLNPLRLDAQIDHFAFAIHSVLDRTSQVVAANC